MENNCQKLKCYFMLLAFHTVVDNRVRRQQKDFTRNNRNDGTQKLSLDRYHRIFRSFTHDQQRSIDLTCLV